MSASFDMPASTSPTPLSYLTVFCAALLFSDLAIAATLTGRVVGVHGGDTITVLGANHTQYKIRLLGIDAPESGQAFGARSKQYLSHLVFDQQVRVEYDKHDRYRRILGKVFGIAPCLAAPCPFAIDVNLAQVQAGMAWWYRYHAKDQSAQDRHAYELAEAEARDAGRGLWAARVRITPWDYRQAIGGHGI